MEGIMANSDVKEILKKLMKPFHPDRHSFRVTGTFRDRRGRNMGVVAFYISSRDVMDRLDAVLGPENWRDDYEMVMQGVMKCALYLRINGEWVGKSDVGTGNIENPESGWKGAASDALKRAAVKWGIGRYLYALPKCYVEVDDRKRIVDEEAVKSFLNKHVTELLKNYQ